MTKGKSYNRIVVLTTLSVYLGLVLVGATPQVLAYAATSRSFDLKTEIELKEDLDNKPENEEAENSPKEDFPILFARLLNEIKENIAAEKVSLPLPNVFSYYGEKTQTTSGSGWGTGGQSYNSFNRLIENAIYQDFLPKPFELADYIRDYKNAKAAIVITDKDFLLKLTFSKEKSDQFAEFLNNEFSSSAKTASDNLLKQLYENTKATFENNQVFIVTRLPRGSIDSLLAKN